MDRTQLYPLEKVNSIVDLGVCFNNNLTFGDHVSKKINNTCRNIKRNFICMYEHTFILLYKAMVRPHIEFANSVYVLSN